MHCYLCNAELTDQNRSLEHIIPGGLGNNITSPDLLCRACNNGLASRIDVGLIGQFQYLYRMVEIARPGTKPSVSLVGKFLDGSTMQFYGALKGETRVEIRLGEMQPIRFSAADDKVHGFVRKRLTQLRATRPNLDVEKTLAEMQVVHQVPEGLVFFSNDKAELSKFGGPEFFRGIKKIAINFYLFKGGDINYIRDVISQVKLGQPAPQRISEFYFPSRRPVHQLRDGEVSHVIRLVGDPKMRVLYCYVELFNTNGALILLHTDYRGKPLQAQYCYDLLAREHIDKPISLPFDFRRDLLDYFRFEQHYRPRMEAAYKRTRQILEALWRAKGIIK